MTNIPDVNKALLALDNACDQVDKAIIEIEKMGGRIIYCSIHDQTRQIIWDVSWKRNNNNGA